jgi:ribosomal protein S18 acetylase RimI-like enzyme
MNGSKKDQCVTMVNHDLLTIPVCGLSPDYQIHWYTPGDEEIWVNIQKVADKYNIITNQLFLREFGDGSFDLQERQCYIYTKDGNAFATGTAWAESEGRYKGYGKVHWVAVLPEFQNRGIGTALTSIICQRFIDLGHTQAMLRTSTLREPAIHLYEKFGFEIVSIEDW